MSAVSARRITDALRDEAPPIGTHDGRKLTPLIGN